MGKQDFPEERVIEVANGLLADYTERYVAVLDDNQFHDFSHLRNFSIELDSRLVENMTIPGDNRQAIVMDVEGTPFIILDPSLQSNSSEKLFAFAHELSHVMLDHLKRLNYVSCGYSAALRKGGYSLPELFCAETELEAELMSFMVVVPDKYLKSLVEKHIFIPTRKIAGKFKLEVERVAARVQLFRKMYGYDRTLELLKQQPQDTFCMIDPQKRISLEENTDGNYLMRFLPKVDPAVYSLIS